MVVKKFFIRTLKFIRSPVARQDGGRTTQRFAVAASIEQQQFWALYARRPFRYVSGGYNQVSHTTAIQLRRLRRTAPNMAA